MATEPGPIIAFVDDHQALREAVGEALRREGFRVEPYADGQEAWEMFTARGLPDLAILDILMPRLDGRELCRRLRALSERLPILFLSSRDEEFDRVLGLELGADDYLCKPFSMRELVARVRVLLRRAALAASPSAEDEERIVPVGPLVFDLRRYSAAWSGRPLPLTLTEFNLLYALGRRPGHVKSRAQLLQEGYPDDAYVSERTIDSHVKRLRRKLAAVAPEAEELIETVYGLGYRLRQP